MATTNEAKRLAEAKNLAKVLPKISGIPKGLDAKALTALIARFEGGIDLVKRINADRTRAVNDKNAARKAVGNLLKRIRSAVKGIHGDDSSEYEMVGGKRLSERKKPRRRRPA